MTEKELNAIKTFKHWIEYEKANKEKINKAYELIEIQETVLKALEQKDKEIERISEIYEQLHKTHIQTRRSLKGIINKQNKEISELKEEINYWKECAEGEAGLRKQIQEDYQEQMQELLESED